MFRSFASLCVAVFLSSLACADATLRTFKPLEEVWEAAYVQNEAGVEVKIGHVHLFSAFTDPNQKTTIRTTKELRLVISRGENKAEMKADMSTVEDPKGQIESIKAKLWLGKDRTQILDCNVINDGKTLQITADGEFKYQREFRWEQGCLGLAGEQTLLRDKKAKPGDEVEYRYFEPQVANYVTVHVAVKEKQKVVVPGGGKRDLLKVLAISEPLTLKDGRKIQMPSATFWVDPTSYDTIKTEMDIPEIGKVSLVRTSKAAALLPNGQVPDLMKRQSIFLKAAVRGMHEREGITYRIAFTGDIQPKELLSVDSRQAIENAKGNTFDLKITSQRSPSRILGKEKAGDEFLRSNYFLNSDDAEVKKLATRAVGRATDPWEKAQKIERFVNGFMQSASYTEAMAPADHVARTRTGDCTEYSMLTAAMCRAQGVPSRTAIGVVYVDGLLGKPAGLAFHMWTEVFVNGQWLGLDATLGQGSIGPGHIKITDHSWDSVISFTPLLPVKGFIMANPTIEVVGK